MERARADIAAAEARTAEYEQRLREARAALFKRQEARRQKALQARAAVVAQARAKAQERVEQARREIEKDKLAAQAGLKVESARLAANIALCPSSQEHAGWWPLTRIEACARRLSSRPARTYGLRLLFRSQCVAQENKASPSDSEVSRELEPHSQSQNDQQRH